MTRFHRSFLLLAASAPLLAACGEGWVMQPIRNYAPYNDERTAGSGVAWVRAYMLPEKGPVLAPVAEISSETPAPAPAIQSDPISDAAPIFEAQQTKEPK